MGSRRHHKSLVLAWAVALPGLTGCAAVTQYRVKTSQPWPDEWISGARVPYERVILLTGETVAWHRKASWRTVQADVARQLAKRRDLYGFIRTGVAQPLGGLGPSAGLHYLEVKVGPCFFDFQRPPPRVTLDYNNKPFAEAMADLMERAGRSYVISPDLAGRPAITARLVDLDWREAAVRLMLECDVFIEPVWYNPISLRSYEYAAQSEFVAAVRGAIDAIKSPAPDAPLTVVSWQMWMTLNRAYQLRYDAALRARPTTQQLGPPPGTAILHADLGIAKKQILYALPHQLKHSSLTPTTSPEGVRP